MLCFSLEYLSNYLPIHLVLPCLFSSPFIKFYLFLFLFSFSLLLYYIIFCDLICLHNDIFVFDLSSLIDVSEIRLKVSLETAPAQRPHGVLGVWSPILSAVGNAFKIQVESLYLSGGCIYSLFTYWNCCVLCYH